MELWITLGVLLTMIAGFMIYGYFSGGVEAMLERERNHNTIDASTRYTIKELIDFFGQVKRVDSLYIHQTQLQLKTNNRLSEPFNLRDIKRWIILVGETTVLDAKTETIQMTMPETLATLERFDPTHPNAYDPDMEVEWQWVTDTTTHYLRFDRNERLHAIVMDLIPKLEAEVF